MNAIDINRLQVLNDLIAQTIDIMNQRGLAMAAIAQPQINPFAGGLSHTPFAGVPTPFGIPGIPQIGVPQIGVPQYGMPYSPFAGLSHTPWTSVQPTYVPQLAVPQYITPQIAQSFAQPWNVPTPFVGGLSHTPFVGGLAQTPFVDPRFIPVPFAGGLSHTPYIDPRWAAASRSTFPLVIR